jgi:hypothetical protein
MTPHCRVPSTADSGSRSATPLVGRADRVEAQPVEEVAGA